MTSPVVVASDLSKRFLLRHNPSASLKVRFLGIFHKNQREVLEDFWALKNISIQIGQGEAVGLVGRNGSGKSTFLKLVAAIYHPTAGRLLVARGARIGTMIELGVGFHPELSGTENVFLNAAINGLSRQETDAIYGDVVRYAGLEQFMDVPLKNYSSGMYVRLGFAVAAHLDPDILLLDEIFAVGDEDFQKHCMKTLAEFQSKGKTILFVSHSGAAVQAICRRVCLIDQGRLLYDGGVDEGLTLYQHLIASLPADSTLRGPSAAFSRSEELGPLDSGSAEAELDKAWHRAAGGGMWAQAGEWQFQFMRHHGLESHHFVLDLGCGSLAGAVHFLRFTDQSRYWGFERRPDLLEAGLRIELPRAGARAERGHFVINESFDLSEAPNQFDFIIANSLFRRHPLNSIARCIASVSKQLKPGGKFFATWFDNLNAADFEPISRPGGVMSYPDAEPYHYSFDLLEKVCEAVGLKAERLGDSSHPRGEAVMLITHRASSAGQRASVS